MRLWPPPNGWGPARSQGRAVVRLRDPAPAEPSRRRSTAGGRGTRGRRRCRRPRRLCRRSSRPGPAQVAPQSLVCAHLAALRCCCAGVAYLHLRAYEGPSPLAEYDAENSGLVQCSPSGCSIESRDIPCSRAFRIVVLVNAIIKTVIMQSVSCVACSAVAPGRRSMSYMFSSVRGQLVGLNLCPKDMRTHAASDVVSAAEVCSRAGLGQEAAADENSEWLSYA